jgi:hypothetical protein
MTEIFNSGKVMQSLPRQPVTATKLCKHETRLLVNAAYHYNLTALLL